MVTQSNQEESSIEQSKEKQQAWGLARRDSWCAFGTEQKQEVGG